MRTQNAVRVRGDTLNKVADGLKIQCGTHNFSGRMEQKLIAKGQNQKIRNSAFGNDPGEGLAKIDNERTTRSTHPMRE